MFFYDNANSEKMPVDGWRSRGNYGSKPHYRRSNSFFPSEQESYKSQRIDRRLCCYHYAQQSAEMNEEMNRRRRLGEEQKRCADAERLCGKDIDRCPKTLRKQPLHGDVTLTVEIPNADYPTIVGLLDSRFNDDSIPNIMKETGVRVRFPDIPITGANINFKNQVKLTGSLVKVEEARHRIRKFSPVAVAFPLCMLRSHIPVDQMKKYVESAISSQRINFARLKITVEHRPPFISNFFQEIFGREDLPICVVKGSMSNEEDIFCACNEICKLLDGSDDDVNQKSFYVSWMDVPIAQQLTVTGFPNGFLMRLVSLKSNASIFFPPPGDRSIGATMFYFTGSVQATLLARRYVQGLLPVNLSFDANQFDLVDPPKLPDRDLCFREERMDIKVNITSSVLESERIFNDDPFRDHVVIESTEHNLTNVYKMRRRLLRTSAQNDAELFPDDFRFLDKEFRQFVAANNKFIAEGAGHVNAPATVEAPPQVPVFDPKVPAPFCSSQTQRPTEVWREGVRPQQAWVVNGMQPAPSFNGPFYVSQSGPRWTAPALHSTCSLPSFNYPQYHSPSTTVLSEERSFADTKTDHSQCSSSDAPNSVLQFLESFKSRDQKMTSYDKRSNPMNRATR